LRYDLPIRLAPPVDGVATLTLCRPEEKNVINLAFGEALLAHCGALRSDRDVRSVVLQAEGPLFCAGGDVKEMAAHVDDLPGHIDRLIGRVHEAVQALCELPLPTVACVQGTAAGGGAAIALCCDFVVAAPSARFVIAYPQLGTTPDCGLSHTLSQRLGPHRALQVFLGQDAFDAAEGHRLGLVTTVEADAGASAMGLATRLARFSASAVGGAKRLFLQDTRMALREQLDRERLSFIRCAHTHEFRARVLAFAAGKRTRDA